MTEPAQDESVTAADDPAADELVDALGGDHPVVEHANGAEHESD